MGPKKGGTARSIHTSLWTVNTGYLLLSAVLGFTLLQVVQCG